MYSKLLCTIATPQEMQHDRHQAWCFHNKNIQKLLHLGSLFVSFKKLPYLATSVMTREYTKTNQLDCPKMKNNACDEIY